MMAHNIKPILIALLALTTTSSVAKNPQANYTSNPTLITQGENYKNLTLEPSRTKFVDQIGNNLLYRGSLPIDSKQFVLQKVLDSMLSQGSRATPVNKTLVAPDTLPKSNYFIDFSLLTKVVPVEKAQYNIENDFFLQNPKVGKLVHYDIDVLFIKGLISKTVGKLIDPVVVNLHAQLSEQAVGSSRIIYVHCEMGVDRTGALISGYAMRYLKYSYKDALALNAKLQLRNPNNFAQLAIKLYAKYLKDIIGIKTIGDI